MMYDMRMPSIKGGILGWNIDIYSTPMDQSDCSISRAYVINVYRTFGMLCMSISNAI